MTQRDSEIFRYFELYKEGIEAGFNFFYNLYSQPLLHFGERHFQDTCAVEEILNDAFLSTWELRGLIECPRHLYCFIRLRLKWGCIKYYHERKSAGMVFVENMDDTFRTKPTRIYDHPDKEELIRIIYKAISLLPPTRANVMKLYFSYGLSCKQIARHYQSSNQHVASQLRASIDSLKKIVKNKKRVTKFQIISTKKFTELRVSDDERLRSDQLLLFKMRYEEKCSFEMIASRLGMDISVVRRKYVEAHRMLRSFKTGKKHSCG